MATPELQLQLLFGPGAGRTVSFSDGPVTFGRDADNALIVPESFVSRKHGEIRPTPKGWELVNLSPNGTFLGRRRITTKPRALRPGDVIRIGHLPVFKISLGHATAAVTEPSAAPAGSGSSNAPASTPVLSKRAKMLLGICGAWVLVLLLLAVLIVPSPKGSSNVKPGQALTVGQIRAIFDKPLPPRPEDPARAKESFDRAETLWAGSGTARSNQYKAYRAYMEALAYQNKTQFDDPKVAYRFLTVHDSVLKDLTDRYANACNLYYAKNFPAAANEFRALSNDVMDLFAGDVENPVFRSILDFRKLLANR